jgi:microcystin-dependent protein
MSSSFVGQIALFGFNFAPRNYAFCNGQTLSIGSNAALFSLLGTTYGGNGTNTFALPDLRGRVAVHFGQGVGLSTYVIGEIAGAENVTLTVGQMPAHNHTVNSTAETAANGSPHSKYLAASGTPLYLASPMAVETMNPAMLNVAGGSQPFNVIQPTLALNYCIALVGVYPSRN